MSKKNLPQQRWFVSDQYSDNAPLPLSRALPALARCVVESFRLMALHRLRQPKDNVGRRIEFGDGTSAAVYRETVVEGAAVDEPAVLFVEFRLRAVRGRGHAAFRAESLLNTPLFAGFRGFRTKLWLRHDAEGRYRGIYQWNGAQAAEDYARALWWVLALVCPPETIHYRVCPGRYRDDVLNNPGTPTGAAACDNHDVWWLPRPAASAG